MFERLNPIDPLHSFRHPPAFAGCFRSEVFLARSVDSGCQRGTVLEKALSGCLHVTEVLFDEDEEPIARLRCYSCGARASERIKHDVARARVCLDERRDGYHGLLVRVKVISGIFPGQNVPRWIGWPWWFAFGQKESDFVTALGVPCAGTVFLNPNQMAYRAETVPLPCFHKPVAAWPAIEGDTEPVAL